MHPSPFPLPASRPGRRHQRSIAVAILAVAIVATACSSKSGPAPDSIAALKKGDKEYSLVQAQASLAVGTSRLVFGLVPVNAPPRVGGAPKVWVATSETAHALGPFQAKWVTWSANRTDVNGAPPVPGFYAVDVRIPRPGNWTLYAQDRAGGNKIGGVAAIPVSAHPPAAIGSPAVSEPTPVGETPEELAKIDTRTPPAPMHYISLDAALTNGLPTVLVFATPLLCQSRMCGPVVDEVLDVYGRVGRDRANFVDVEIYPERDANKPAPEFLKWGFESEPWVVVIDKTGIVRARFEGPSVAAEIERALTPLLSAA